MAGPLLYGIPNCDTVKRARAWLAEHGAAAAFRGFEQFVGQTRGHRFLTALAGGFPTGQAHHFFMDRFTEAFRTELAAFVDVVRGGPVQGATVADAVEVAWIAEAATESLRRGTPVRISEVRR